MFVCLKLPQTKRSTSTKHILRYQKSFTEPFFNILKSNKCVFKRHFEKKYLSASKTCHIYYPTWKVNSAAPIRLGLSWPLTNRHLLGVAAPTFTMV